MRRRPVSERWHTLTAAVARMGRGILADPGLELDDEDEDHGELPWRRRRGPLFTVPAVRGYRGEEEEAPPSPVDPALVAAARERLDAAARFQAERADRERAAAQAAREAEEREAQREREARRKRIDAWNREHREAIQTMRRRTGAFTYVCDHYLTAHNNDVDAATCAMYRELKADKLAEKQVLAMERRLLRETVRAALQEKYRRR